MVDPEPSIRTSLMFRGDFDPLEITTRTGLTPSRTWRAGDPIYQIGTVRTLIKFDDDGWRYTIAESEEWTFEAHLSELLRVVTQLTSQISDARVSTGSNLIVRLSGFTNGSAPVIELSPELMSILASIGASILVDISHVPPDEPEHPEEP